MSTILIIDNDLRQTSSKVDLLRKRGYEVIPCTDVDSCLEIVEDYRKGKVKIDCILLDVMMPSGQFKSSDTDKGRNTGLILHREIRKRLGKPIPTIVVTVRNEEELMKEFLHEEGITGFLTKPVRIRNIEDEIERALN